MKGVIHFVFKADEKSYQLTEKAAANANIREKILVYIKYKHTRNKIKI